MLNRIPVPADKAREQTAQGKQQMERNQHDATVVSKRNEQERARSEMETFVPMWLQDIALSIDTATQAGDSRAEFRIDRIPTMSVREHIVNVLARLGYRVNYSVGRGNADMGDSAAPCIVDTAWTQFDIRW